MDPQTAIGAFCLSAIAGAVLTFAGAYYLFRIRPRKTNYK